MIKAVNRDWALELVAALTAAAGLFTLSSTLFALVHLHDARLVIADAHLTLIAGISLIYLAAAARRGKRNAWLVSLLVFTFLLVRNIHDFGFDDEISRHYAWLATTNLVFPAMMLVALIVFRGHYRVKSGAKTFRIAWRRTLIILIITFLYGVVGFQLFDQSDFHQEISPPQAAHYTIDQFGLTTNNHPTAYSRRAVFFVDSLASVSIAALAYVAIAFFAPVRFRLTHRRQDYEDAERIVARSARSSEDFFKLWPRDKVYFLNPERSAVIAYRVARGVALAVGDPLGKPAERQRLLADFLEFCRTNDWRPAFIHTDDGNLKLYKKHGLEAQKLGEEALVDVQHFLTSVAGNKYFRNISNRFKKAGYSFEMVQPPHDDRLLKQLERISKDWLTTPGRAERGLMQGYYDNEYLQQCPVALVRDGDGRVQAFLNQVPTVKRGEANYDFLRSASGGLGNINDYLMLNFIHYLSGQGYSRLNMGLCPLSGLDQSSETDKTLVNSVLRFGYVNGGRFYSFEGLARFKAKYEPDWENRYIIYSGSLAGFGRTLNALLKAMADVRLD